MSESVTTVLQLHYCILHARFIHCNDNYETVKFYQLVFDLSKGIYSEYIYILYKSVET
jgi:hypothetical protein